MPCDTIQQSQVEFLAKSTDVKLLAEALRKMGFTVNETETHLTFAKYGVNGTYTKATGKFETRGYESVDTNEVKQAYSKEVVTTQAKKFGWQLEWSTNPQTGNNEAKVVKRG